MEAIVGAIERYARREMGGIWSEENKFQKWLEVEIAVLRAKVNRGMIPYTVVDSIEKEAVFKVERIKEIERENKHDLLAFVEAVRENLSDNYAGEFHKGLTSYDVEDTALSLLIKESIEIIIEDIKGLMESILRRAKQYKNTAMMGRTHGQQAQLTTFGMLLLDYYNALDRSLRALDFLKREVGVGKISGAVGAYTEISPDVEEVACYKLGLKPTRVSSQIIFRDIHARITAELSVIGGILEKIATDIRLLSIPEIGEVREPFGKKQKGSSAMPHKKNPITCENTCALTKVLRGMSLAALEDISTWLQRDLTQSGAERFIFSHSFILLDRMLFNMKKVIDGLEVFPEKMEENIKRSFGVYASQGIRDTLIRRGMDSEKAYNLIQKACFRAVYSRKSLEEVLQNKKDVKELISVEELKSFFKFQRYLRYIDDVFAKFP